MFLARRNSRCFSLLKETLPKGHFNLSKRVNFVAQGRICSIWKGAWGEFGWFLVRFVLLLPWTDSPPQPCDLLAGHRAWSLHSLQHILTLLLRTLWLAAPLAPGLAFQLPSSPVWQGRGCQETAQDAQLQEEGQTTRSPLAWRHCSLGALVSAWAQMLLAGSQSLVVYYQFPFHKRRLCLTEFSVMRSECLIPCISHGIEIVMMYKLVLYFKISLKVVSSCMIYWARKKNVQICFSLSYDKHIHSMLFEPELWLPAVLMIFCWDGRTRTHKSVAL